MDYAVTSLPIALPEELGIIDNVYVHLTLSNNRYVQIKANSYQELRYHSNTGEEWPKLFDETTKKQLSNWKIEDNDEPNTSVFWIIYTCYDESYMAGSFVVTFTSWKDEQLKYFYTEKVHFNLNEH